MIPIKTDMMPKNKENESGIEEIQQQSKNIECENIGKPKRKLWNNDDVERLKRLYEIDGKSLSDLILEFPDRTESSIHLKIKRLKLRHTSEQKYNIWSKVRMGNKNPMFGKNPTTKGYTKFTLECLRKGSKKLSNTIKEKIKRGEWGHKGKDNPMFGKPSWSRGLTKNTCEKLKLAGEKGSVSNKKRFEKMTSEEKKNLSQKIKENITENVRLKMRLSAINRMKRNGILLCRNYNENACKYFDELNKQNGWNLIHAKNGGECEAYGYFLDAYDKEKNIVVEYDEPHHKKPSNILKDELRQKNIINCLKPNSFFRYDEKTNTLNKIV